MWCPDNTSVLQDWFLQQLALTDVGQLGRLHCKNPLTLLVLLVTSLTRWDQLRINDNIVCVTSCVTPLFSKY